MRGERSSRRPTSRPVAKKLTAVVKGRLRLGATASKKARSTAAKRVRVTLLRKVGSRWAKVRTVTVRVDSRGRFTARAKDVPAGQYKANASLAKPGAKPIGWQGTLRLA